MRSFLFFGEIFGRAGRLFLCNTTPVLIYIAEHRGIYKSKGIFLYFGVHEGVSNAEKNVCFGGPLPTCTEHIRINVLLVHTPITNKSGTYVLLPPTPYLLRKYTERIEP